MKDIENREDLEKLLSEFYKTAVADDLIGHHFVELDLATHLPVIVDFWEKTLFKNPVYFGNPLFVHKLLHEKSPLEPEHFDRWVEIFKQTVEANFAGERAEEAKLRARAIADTLDRRLNEPESGYVRIEKP
jgi:hemoglobin